MWTVLAIAAAIGVVGAALIRVPYYAQSPGSIRATEPLIDLGEVERDPDAGEVAFATVSLDGRINLLQAFSGWLDDTIKIVPERDILGGQSPEENREANQVLMADSKQVAVNVALGWLGLAAPAGAEVAARQAGSPAEAVLADGDVIVAVDGVPITTADELVARVREAKVGQTMTLRIEGRADEVTITLGASERDPNVALLGVNVRDAFVETYEGEVRIDSGQVGGPSAGLAFTLGIIDLLSAGDLTGGEKVAATGTIDGAGRVGPIGGIEQKAVAARRAGITVFLVPDSLPASELAGARELADGVELVPVGSLQDALVALEARGGEEVALPASGR